MLYFLQKSMGNSCISAVTEMKPHCPAAVSALSRLLLLLVIFLDLTSMSGSCKSYRLKCQWKYGLEDWGERNKSTETCGFSEILPPNASWAINCLSKSQQAPPVIYFLSNGTHSITHNSFNKQKCSLLVSRTWRYNCSFSSHLKFNVETDVVICINLYRYYITNQYCSDRSLF